MNPSDRSPPEAQTLPAPSAAAADDGANAPTLAPTSSALTGSHPEGRPAVPGYEVVRELGRGGMGVVYEARQIGLKRTVALKMILAGAHAGEAERERFQAEAEAIARLHHPHIVQIYDIGAHEGHLYFAMEYVADGSLEQRLDGTPWEARPAAELTETLAWAIHHAHEQGIVHRDLKPANVLLTLSGPSATGEMRQALRLNEVVPKITDFGLAKQLDVDSQRTATGVILGTPSYMAPEQASGRSREIGPATDVYALGAILYEMLTGRPPFRAATPLDTVLQVVSTDPIAPSRLWPTVPRDLETICLKCLHKEPGRRYGGALELAEDLRRFSNGESVRARPVGRLERGRRWCRRNPVVAALVLAVVLAFLGGFIGVAWQWYGAERARTVAQDERDRADEQARQAQASFDLARQAIDESFTTMSGSKLLDAPHLQPLRKELLESALRYYEGFLRQRGNDPAVRQELARAYARVGAITADLGPKTRAIEAYQKAIALLEEHMRERPESIEVQGELAKCAYQLGLVWIELDRQADALPTLERALRMREQLVEQHPEQAALRLDLAASANAMGLAQVRMQQASAARQSIDRALAIYRQFVKDDPDRADHHHALGGSLNSLGHVLAQQGQYSEALTAFKEAGDQATLALYFAPQVALYREWEANHHFNQALVLEMYLNRPVEAIAYRALALTACERLALEHPFVTAYRFRWARACVDLGNALGAHPKLRAQPYYEKGRDLLDALGQGEPDVASYRSHLGAAWDGIAGVMLRKNRPTEARMALQEAIRNQRRAVIGAPGEEQYRRFLFNHWKNLARACQALNQPAKALDALEQAHAVAEGSARTEEKLLQLITTVADACLRAGLGQLQQGNPDRAMASIKRVQEFVSTLDRELQESPEILHLLAGAWKCQGDVEYLGKRSVAARAAYEQARQLWERLVRSHPEDLNYHHSLGGTWHNLGSILGDEGMHAEALAAYQRAVQHQRPVYAQQPERSRQWLSNHYESLATTARKLGRPADAAAASRQRRLLWATAPQTLFEIACELAQCVSLAGGTEREQYAGDAVTTLRQAVAQGFADAESLQKDARLEPVRGHDAFRQLAAEVGMARRKN